MLRAVRYSQRHSLPDKGVMKQMEPAFFVEGLKISDVIFANTFLLDILPHFGIVDFGWNHKTVQEVCDRHNVSVPLFLFICNLYTFDRYDFAEKLNAGYVSVEEIVGYLQGSHKYILEFHLPQIFANIAGIEKRYCSIFGNLMSRLGAQYEKTVSEHIKYEEEVAFPYIMRLLNGEKPGECEIRQNSYVLIEAAVSDLKNIVINYVPDCKLTACRELLLNLFTFEYALEKHKLVEEILFMSLVPKLEGKI